MKKPTKYFTKIIDEHPITYSENHIDNALFTDLNKREQEKVALWIQANIEPQKNINRWQSSYGLKHILEHDTGIYMTNNQFKDLMLEYAFEPVDIQVLNWRFSIKKVTDRRCL